MHSDRAGDLAERGQFSQRPLGSAGFEQHATSRKAQMELMPWRDVRRERAVDQLDRLVEVALDEHLGEEAVAMQGQVGDAQRRRPEVERTQVFLGVKQFAPLGPQPPSVQAQ